MTSNKYSKITEATSTTGKNDVLRKLKFLWEKLQSLLTDFLKRLIVTDREGCIGTAIDDDKVWSKSIGENAEDRKKIHSPCQR